MQFLHTCTEKEHSAHSNAQYNASVREFSTQLLLATATIAAADVGGRLDGSTGAGGEQGVDNASDSHQATMSDQFQWSRLPEWVEVELVVALGGMLVVAVVSVDGDVPAADEEDEVP